jgi:hypothetical protein
MKAWLKGGLIGLGVGYIGYIGVYIIAFLLFYKRIGIGVKGVSLIGSIPSFTWFIIYSTGFFLIGVLINWLYGKIRGKKK